MPSTAELERLREVWQGRWEEALAQWSRYTRLQAPRWCLTEQEEAAEELSGGFAMIRLADHAVVISLRLVALQGLERFPLEIMAHEIGHHVYCPADLSDHGRLLARIRVALPTMERHAGLIANLYADLLLNDRLQRSAELNMAGVYRALGQGSTDPLWTLYMRIYEILWSLPRGTLTSAKVEPSLEGDARLGARLIRAYSNRWLEGGGRFAALCLRYLLEDESQTRKGPLARWGDTQAAGSGGEPHGLSEIEDGELEGAIHPAHDPELGGVSDALGAETADGDRDTETGASGGRSQLGGHKKQDRYRSPIEYGELLRALDQSITAQDAAVHYYRERSLPHLIHFPTLELPQTREPLPEGLAVWDLGDPLEDADWVETVIQSPGVIPGLTTVQRHYGSSSGELPEHRAPDLYVGIDCSGSMPNPRRALSYPVLAGTILALSALRAGARVMAVLSGEPGRTASTGDFLSDERKVLELLTDYLGTGYGFGVHRLDEIFAKRAASARPVHILIITDQDIFSMLDDRKGKRSGWTVAAEALQAARAGATMVLNMPKRWSDKEVAKITAMDWEVHRIYDWEELIAFARAFSRRTYER